MKENSECTDMDTCVCCLIACAFGSSFQLGVQLASVNTPTKFINDWFKQSHKSLWNETLSDTDTELHWFVYRTINILMKSLVYTHNFSFTIRRDIICPVSFAIFLCFSLPLHGIAMPHCWPLWPHICRPCGIGHTFVGH